MRILFALTCMVFSLTVWAQAPATSFVEGVHYQKLESPLRTLSVDKVEVAELFWYGCGHCYNFEPVINKWKENLPETASLVRVPGSWQKEHAKLYYTAEFLNILDKAHPEIFKVMHNDPKRRPHQMLKSDKEIKDFFLGLGVSEADFDKEYNSGSVKMALSFADSNVRLLSKQMAKKGIQVSTPSMVVAGKYYVTLNKDVARFENMLEVTDFLITKEAAVK